LLVALLTALVGALLVGTRLAAPSPAPIAEPGDLAYAVDGDIFLADWDGSDAVRVADGQPDGRSGCGPFGFVEPTWSPDGRYLAVRPGFDPVACQASSSFAIMDPGGHVVGSFPGYGWEAAWSPGSTRVATWSDHDQRAFGVHSPDGTPLAVLDLPDGYSVMGDHDPRWSPDGESLLIALARGVWIQDPVDENTYHFRSDDGYAPSQVWELPLDGEAPRLVAADDPRSHRTATWSGDRTLVAWADFPASAGVTAGTSWSLMVAEADGSRSREVVSTPLWSDGVAPGDLLMSPAGDGVVFRAGDAPDEFRMVDLVTGLDAPLAHAGLVGGPGDGLQAIEFSPEGDRVLFTAWSRDGTGSLWSVGADGSDPRLLVAGATDGGWRP
jgi:Tol biopolymer transport system component